MRIWLWRSLKGWIYLYRKQRRFARLQCMKTTAEPWSSRSWSQVEWHQDRSIMASSTIGSDQNWSQTRLKWNTWRARSREPTSWPRHCERKRIVKIEDFHVDGWRWDREGVSRGWFALRHVYLGDLSERYTKYKSLDMTCIEYRSRTDERTVERSIWRSIVKMAI